MEQILKICSHKNTIDHVVASRAYHAKAVLEEFVDSMNQCNLNYMINLHFNISKLLLDKKMGFVVSVEQHKLFWVNIPLDNSIIRIYFNALNDIIDSGHTVEAFWGTIWKDCSTVEELKDILLKYVEKDFNKQMFFGIQNDQ